MYEQPNNPYEPQPNPGYQDPYNNIQDPYGNSWNNNPNQYENQQIPTTKAVRKNFLVLQILFLFSRIYQIKGS